MRRLMFDLAYRLCLCIPLALIGIVGVGCGRKMTVTYFSDPPGALLRDDIKVLGRMPITLYYDPEGVAQHAGKLAEITAEWADGASFSLVPQCNPQSGYADDDKDGYKAYYEILMNHPDPTAAEVLRRKGHGSLHLQGGWMPDCFAGIADDFEPLAARFNPSSGTLDIRFDFDFSGFLGNGNAGNMTCERIPVRPDHSFSATRYSSGNTTVRIVGRMHNNGSISGTISWDSDYPLVQCSGQFEARRITRRPGRSQSR